MESNAGDVSICEYETKGCKLKDGYLMWQTNKLATCPYQPAQIINGRTLGGSFISADGTIAMTSSKATLIRGCEPESLIHQSDQGMLYTFVNPLDTLRVRREAVEGLNLTIEGSTTNGNTRRGKRQNADIVKLGSRNETFVSTVNNTTNPENEETTPPDDDSIEYIEEDLEPYPEADTASVLHTSHTDESFEEEFNHPNVSREAGTLNLRQESCRQATETWYNASYGPNDRLALDRSMIRWIDKFQGVPLPRNSSTVIM